MALALLLAAAGAQAQQGVIRGTVKDKANDEALIGANVVFKDNPGRGVATDLDGNFELQAPYGTATLLVSYTGFETAEVSVEVGPNTKRQEIALQSVMLNEVLVVADIARARETPIAFSNILPAKLDEELAGRDIPMVLNSTPGVYATEQGGGDGDARITIRGFSQNNVAVMLDGVPVNDMENGWVYWSNWFGLDAITRSIQVQRGLGASKLGIPSVGGTMNIMTQGMALKPSASVKQEVTSYGYYRTTVGATSGRIGDWSTTVGASYKWGDGWADASGTQGFFYYLKVERRLGRHNLSITGFGAPQRHQQRSYNTSIMAIDSTYAVDVAGVDAQEWAEKYADKAIWVNRGTHFNQHWGDLRRWELGAGGDTLWSDNEQMTEKTNYYHKPQFSLKDVWTVNNDLFIATTAYLSVGRGGGTGILQSVANQNRVDGQMPFQDIYDRNANNIRPNLDNLAQSTNYIYSSVNNHMWYGLISSAEWNMSETLNLSGGIDARYYKGEHYREVYDLLGGDIALYETGINPKNNVIYSNRYKRVGDKIYYYNDGLVGWGGVFGQLEYKDGLCSGFVSGSLSNSSYRRVDHFAKYMYGDTQIKLRKHPTDPSLYVSDTITVDGQRYYIGHPDVTQKHKYSDWTNFLGYTIKAGFNYNLSERMNAFVNLGNLSKAPRFNNVFANNTQNVAKNIDNELVYAAELGTSYKSPKLSWNLNGYYTHWKNKPMEGSLPSKEDLNTGETIYLNITGIGARHMGIELDGVYKPIRALDLQAFVSLGDWIYTTADSVNYVDAAGLPVEGEAAINYDAYGVHVGDAAQVQIGGSVRYNIIPGLFVQARVTNFQKHYAAFDPETLTGANKRRESWRAPGYTLLDLTAGYTFKIHKEIKGQLSVNLLNALDTFYISDALNNYGYLDYGEPNNFDAVSAGVYFGMGRRLNASFKIFF